MEERMALLSSKDLGLGGTGGFGLVTVMAGDVGKHALILAMGLTPGNMDWSCQNYKSNKT